ncbi:hypothetical protein CHI12_18560, partial [Terribacillus saccharophilus]
YKITYFREDKKYVNTISAGIDKLPSNIVVSSYTPIDKLNDFTVNEPILYKTSNNTQSIKSLASRILKKYTKDSFDEVYTILNYIG